MSRLRFFLSCCVVTGTIVASLSTPASATDPASKVRDLQTRERNIKVQLDLAKASDDSVAAEATRLTRALQTEDAYLASAQSAAAAANAETASAEAQLASVTARAATTRRALVARGVQLYMHPLAEQTALFNGASDLNQVARRGEYISVVVGNDTAVLDAYRRDRIDLSAADAKLRVAKAATDQRLRAVDDETGRVRNAQLSVEATKAALDRRVAELAQESRVLAAQESGLETLIRARQSGGALAGSTGSGIAVGLRWPLHGPVTSEFGPRWGGFHPGIDIAPPFGTPIHAAAGGIVIFAGPYGGYGNFVVIDHGNGVATAYAHQSQIAVSQGQTIAQGGLVGYEGSTGYSTGPHLHFEVRINGTPQNPRNYVPGAP